MHGDQKTGRGPQDHLSIPRDQKIQIAMAASRCRRNSRSGERLLRSWTTEKARAFWQRLQGRLTLAASVRALPA